MNIEELDFKKGNGLVPAIIQDANTWQILMLGYMNKEAIKQTLEKKLVTFYSRSKQRLWTKGESSGNTLELVDLQADCDNDTVLILARPGGPTCHTGNRSCFYEKEFKPDENTLAFLGKLETVIENRKEEMPEDSYTSSLFSEGIDKIAQKVGEEAVETIIAAKNEETDKLVGETSDLIYHLMVLLVEKGISLRMISEHLTQRHLKAGGGSPGDKQGG